MTDLRKILKKKIGRIDFGQPDTSGIQCTTETPDPKRQMEVIRTFPSTRYQRSSVALVG
jgi:hypothetical protein